jgi:hypothetical protein
MRLLNRIMMPSFPGSLQEYQESHKIHLGELRRYRTQPQYLAGIILFHAPWLYLAVFGLGKGDWLTPMLLLCILFGEMFIRDTISEHYCLLLHRLGYGKEPPPAPG